MKRGGTNSLDSVPIVSGFVEDIPTEIYLDSESQPTIVNSNLILKEILNSGFQIKTQDKLFGISGHLLQSQGCLELTFNVAGKEVCVPAWLSSSITRSFS